MNDPDSLILAVVVGLIIWNSLVTYALLRVLRQLAEDNRRKDETIATMKNPAAKRYMDRREEERAAREKDPPGKVVITTGDRKGFW